MRKQLRWSKCCAEEWAIENDQAAIVSGKFMRHVTLEDLHAASQIPQDANTIQISKIESLV
ncbi:MAG: hypothetical protein HC866_24630 [Leptolyngbyaceae cyanobacterium RU_5_1]|nr:hypothetical protein [Leptolyngbyaceae cyanobacterium RU_5_1]